MEGKIITHPLFCGCRTFSHDAMWCTATEKSHYILCNNSQEFPHNCPLQSIVLKDNEETLKDIQKEDNLLTLENIIPSTTRVIECPVCRGRGVIHTEENSALIDCPNCNSTGKIELGS